MLLSSPLLFFTFIMVTLFSYPLHATVFDYAMFVKKTTYDNVLLSSVEEGPEKDVANSAGGRVLLVEESRAISADLSARIEKINYIDNVTTDRTLLNLSARALIRITPGRFEWMFSDVFTQTQINVLEGASISNLQDVNLLTTGPNYIVKLNKRNTLKLQFRYLSSKYEVLTTNSDRYATQISEEYAFSPSASFTFNIRNEIVDFKGGQAGGRRSLSTDYVRNDIFFTVQYSKLNSESVIEIGSTDLIFDGDVVDDQKLSRYKLSMLYNNSRTSSIQFLANRSVEDRAINIGNIAFDNVAVDSNATAIDLYLTETLGLTYNKELSSGELSIAPYTNKIRYNIQKNLNVNERGVNIRNSLYLSGRSNFAINLSYVESEYVNIVPNRINKDANYGLTYFYSARRDLNIVLSASYLERESTDSRFAYVDTRLFLSLEYTSD